MEEKVIGIDLLNTDEGGGMYALCESVDGGDTWEIIESGRRIEALLGIAKAKYEETIPVILPFQIREMLRYEILEEREWKRINARQPIGEKSWWEKFLKKFRR